MTGRDKKSVAANALANLAKALVATGSGALAATGNLGVAIVTRALGNTIIDEVKARCGDDATAQDRVERIRNDFAAQDIETLKKLILELGGIVPEDRLPIQALV